jgi:hypothetical protein
MGAPLAADCLCSGQLIRGMNYLVHLPSIDPCPLIILSVDAYYGLDLVIQLG